MHGEVVFNVALSRAALRGMEDAFAQLAQFVTVFPDVKQDLDTSLATIKLSSTGDALAKAEIPLAALAKMIGDVIAAADEGPILADRDVGFVAADDLTIGFSIEDVTPDSSPDFELELRLSGGLPAELEALVLIDPSHYACIRQPDPSGGPDGRVLRFIYLSKTDGSRLTQERAQTIADRQVVLVGLNILRRQDAWAGVQIARNEELVSGKPSAEPFIYKTPDVRFSNPCPPTIDQDLEVDIAKLPPSGIQSLKTHLEALFNALLCDAPSDLDTLTLQVECTYGIPINQQLDPASLPVMMQPPIDIDVTRQTGGGDSTADTTLDVMIEQWADAVAAWLEAWNPDRDGAALWFDLTIMSNMTSRPMPLLRLRRLRLDMANVKEDTSA